MRRLFVLTALIVGCRSGTPPAALAGAEGPTSDAGIQAGPPENAVDGGTPDAGPGAGRVTHPASIDAGPCPATPPVLWSRTVTDLQADFRGVADKTGNVYWIEYTPATFTTPIGPAWLVSTDGTGRDRYRAPLASYSDEGVFLLAGGKILLSNSAVLSAYDAATGTASWAIDLSAKYRASSRVTGVADLGNGEIAFGMSDGLSANGIYLADLATGAIGWSGTGNQVEISNGAGSVLVIENQSSSYLGQEYHTSADVFAIDGTGRKEWIHSIADGPPGMGRVLLWTAGAPWLGITGTQSLSPAGDYVAAPAGWFWAVSGTNTAFAISFGDAITPDAINVIDGGAVIAQGPIVGSNGYDGLASFPFLAGEGGDHLVLVSQVWHSIPSLCHPSKAGAAAISRFDAASSWQCPLQLQGESGITGAVLEPGRVILGRTTYLSNACGDRRVQPVTIEAYALPGESLAPSGWVQADGNPGLGRRPVLP